MKSFICFGKIKTNKTNHSVMTKEIAQYTWRLFCLPKNNALAKGNLVLSYY